MKFKVGDIVKVREDLVEGDYYGGECFIGLMEYGKGKVFEIKEICGRAYILGEDGFHWTDEMLEEVKGKVQEKTFREVIATIKLGEVWESEEKIIRLMNTNDIVITLKDRDRRINSMGFASSVLYYLQRKEHTFEEAFKAYEEGKIIESCYSQYKYKRANGVDLYSRTENNWYEEENFEIDEIRGKWYINN